MSPYRLIVSCWLIVLFFTGSAAAYDIQKGIHGMNWGSPITQYGELTQIKEKGPAAFYVNSSVSYQSDNQPVPAVVYGFYRGKLFAVIIKLRSPEQFAKLERQLSAKHGQPRITTNVSGGQTVYRWKDTDVKLKLKIKEAVSDYKLAIYYAPLAVKLNEEELETLPDSVLESAPSPQDKGVQSEPLLGN